jgi:hypothetical protein
VRDVIAIDTETELIEPGNLTPRLVSLQWAEDTESDVLPAKYIAGALCIYFQDSDTIIVGHNVVFDLLVIAAEDPEIAPFIWKSLADGRVRDTGIREALFAIRDGDEHRLNKLALDDLVRRRLGYGLNKGPDSFRFYYGLLADLDVTNWPDEAINYARADAISTREVYLHQQTELERLGYGSGTDAQFPDEILQVRAAWALQLMSNYGLRTDPMAVGELKLKLESESESLTRDLVAAGILREDGSRDMRAIRSRVEEAYRLQGLPVPRTEPSAKFPDGQVGTDADVCGESGDPVLVKACELVSIEKLLSTYLPALEAGTRAAICARYNLLVASGRTSCRAPNVQNQPRKGGVRECFVPREGNWYVDCDLEAAELKALAQICYSFFGVSALRDAFIEGRDPHCELAAKLCGCSYEEMLKRPDKKEKRVLAKVANFGFPGGLGALSLISFAKGYGVTLSIEQSQELKDNWFASWPEMEPYFEMIGELTSDYSPRQITQFMSGRVRGGLSFCAGANTLFQGLVADAMKAALWEISKACYTDDESALYNSRPVAFIHDEILLESPIALAPAAGEELSRVMNAVVQRWMPDVPVTSTPHLMDRWQKGAETVRDGSGRLVLWTPKEKES